MKHTVASVVRVGPDRMFVAVLADDGNGTSGSFIHVRAFNLGRQAQYFL